MIQNSGSGCVLRAYQVWRPPLAHPFLAAVVTRSSFFLFNCANKQPFEGPHNCDPATLTNLSFCEVPMGSGCLTCRSLAPPASLATIFGRLPPTLLRLRSRTQAAMELATAVGVVGSDLAGCPRACTGLACKRVKLGRIWILVQALIRARVFGGYARLLWRRCHFLGSLRLDFSGNPCNHIAEPL